MDPETNDRGLTRNQVMVTKKSNVPQFRESWAAQVASPLGLPFVMMWFGFAGWLRPRLVGEHRTLLVVVTLVYWGVTFAQPDITADGPSVDLAS